MNQTKFQVGLVLSGGTLKGAAHVGVISALQDLGVPIHCVAGTSAGALVGALLAHGYTAEELSRLIRAFPGVKLLDYGFPISAHLWYHTKKRFHRKTKRKKNFTLKVGLLKGAKLRRYVAGLLAGRHPVLPYYVVATDLNSGLPIVFSNDKQAIDTGKAYAITHPAQAIQASCALPGIFQSVPWKDHLLADGALRHYAPIDILQVAGCEKLIVVNLLTLDTDWQPLTVLDVISRSFEILLRETVDDDVTGDSNLVLIEPSLAHVKWTSLSELEACYAEGRAAVFRKAKQITEMLQSPAQSSPEPRLFINRSQI